MSIVNVAVPRIDYDALPRGDTWRFELAATRNALAVDLTGATIWFTGKRNKADADVDAVFQKKSGVSGVTITNAAGGLFTVVVAPGDTDQLTHPTTKLFYDCQVLEQSGELTTVVEGEITVKADVTKAVAA